MTFPDRRDWHGERRSEASLSEILHVLRGRRLPVLGIVLVLAGVALLFGIYRGPVYTAEAVVSVTPQERLDDEQALEAFVRGVHGDVVTGTGFWGDAMSLAGWSGDLEEFQGRLDDRVYVTRDGSSGVLVSFSGARSEQAAVAVNAYARLFAERVERLDGERLAGGVAVAGAAVEQTAVPSESSSVRPLVYAAVAAGVGLLLGGVWALLLEGRTPGWRGVRDAELSLQAPVLGTIPDYASVEGSARRPAESPGRNG